MLLTSNTLLLVLLYTGPQLAPPFHNIQPKVSDDLLGGICGETERQKVVERSTLFFFWCRGSRDRKWYQTDETGPCGEFLHQISNAECSYGHCRVRERGEGQKGGGKG